MRRILDNVMCVAVTPVTIVNMNGLPVIDPAGSGRVTQTRWLRQTGRGSLRNSGRMRRTGPSRQRIDCFRAYKE
jgi:hypothetical protein